MTIGVIGPSQDIQPTTHNLFYYITRLTEDSLEGKSTSQSSLSTQALALTEPAMWYI